MAFKGDIRLPYADQYTSVPFGDAGGPLPVPPLFDFYNVEFGRIPCRHDWLPPSGSFGGQMNSLTYGLRVRTADFPLALQYILGWARPGGLEGTFKRVLPITDPDGFGMAAVEVGIRGYETPSGMVKLEIPKTDGGVDGQAPDGGVYNNTLSPFFDPTNLPAFPPPGRPNESMKDVYKYVLLNVKFDHVMYWIASDKVAVSFGDATGTTAERQRFMIWNYVPGIEYVALDSNTLSWTADNPFVAPGTTIGKGAGFVRSTGELKGTWYGVPAESLVLMLQKWTGTGAFPPDNTATGNGFPMNGKTNFLPFLVDITNLNGFVTFPTDTLLWQPPRTIIRPNVLGFRTYDVEISLTHRPEGWNKFLYWPAGQYFTAVYQPPVPALPRPVYQQTTFERGFTA